jgi:uncharacterized protein DUF3761
MLLRAILAAAAIGAAIVAVAPAASALPVPDPCYIASSGDCVPDPEAAPLPPPGATAICADGDYSFSEHPHSGGTCHGHGGVLRLLP